MKKSIFIVGSGVVGQATGKGLSGKGFKVTFVDTNPAVVSELYEEGYQAFSTAHLDDLGTNIIMLSVPTYTLPPAENDGIESIRMAAASVGEWLSQTDKYCLIVVRSTVIPGTTENIIIPIIENCSGKRAGYDFGICVNPEYLRERSAEDDFNNPRIIVIGEVDCQSGDLLEEVYYWANCPIYRVSLKEAELQKFVHNLYNATKISFFNEMRLVCQQTGLDGEKAFPLVAQSAEAIWNPAYGTANLGPFGGSCLPKDTAAFLTWAKEQNMEAPILDAVIKVNKIFERQLKTISSQVLA